MREVEFTYSLMATARGRLPLPDDVKDGEELEYIRDHLVEAVADDIEWIGDLDPDQAVDQDDICGVYGERDEEEGKDL